MIKVFFLLFLMIVYPLEWQNDKTNEEYNDSCEANNFAFNTGEKLIYTIYYNWGFVWLPAGEVVFTVNEKDDNYVFTATGKTFPAYNWIFEVDDYFYSSVDKNTLLPVKATRNINEGGYKIYNDINFYQDAGRVVSKVKINDNPSKTVVKKYDSCMYDILSVIYSLRNTDKSILKKGDQIPFDMILDDEIYDLKMEYLGHTGMVKIKNSGKCDAVKISPTVIKGRVFAKNERMEIWISNDKNNIPLIIESPLAVGKIKVVLQDYEGLRYPFDIE